MKKLLLLSSLLFLIIACDKKRFEIDPFFKVQAMGDGLYKFTSETPNATSFEWDFGDGKTSTEENPEHQFNQNGNFKVVLTAKNRKNQKEMSFDLKVIDVPKPSAKFDFSQGTNGLVSFTNLSKYYTQLSWNFRNGDTSNVENPTIKFNYNGEYDVTLYVKSPQGEDGYGRLVKVTNLPPTTTGDLTFWTDGDGPNIKIYLEDKYMGTITRHTSSAPPCRTEGFVTVTVPSGIYEFRMQYDAPGQKIYNLPWLSVNNGRCKNYGLYRAKIPKF